MGFQDDLYTSPDILKVILVVSKIEVVPPSKGSFLERIHSVGQSTS